MDDDLGVAWLVKRLVVSKMLKSKTPPDVSDVDGILVEANTAGRLVWGSMVPAIVKRIVGSGGLEEEIAGEYAHRLGTDLDDVSARALKQGYTASLGKGIDRSLSWARVAEAWGLDGAQMRSFIGTMSTSDYAGEAIPPRSKGQLEVMLNTRADRIRDNESYAISQMAQQIRWIRMVQTGEVGPDVTKQWHTARDEFVCPVCGPINGKIVGLEKTFSRGVFSPPVHPNCRCWVELKEGSVITKNAPARQYARDQDGQFASHNTLVSRPKQTIPSQYRSTAPPPLPQLNKARMAEMYRVANGKVWSDPQRFGLAPESGFDDFNDEVLRRSPYLVKDYPSVTLTTEPNPEIARKADEVSRIIYESKVRAGKEPKKRLQPSYITMPGSKEKIKVKPAELDGWWEVKGLGTTFQHEGVSGDFKIVPAMKDSQSSKSITLVTRPTGHLSSDGSAKLSGRYVAVDNYEVKGRMARQMGLEDGTNVTVLAHEETYLPPSNPPGDKPLPTTRREKSFQSAAATHEVMGPHINFKDKKEKDEDPKPQGTKFGPDKKKSDPNIVPDDWAEAVALADDSVADPSEVVFPEGWEGMSLEEMTQKILDANEGKKITGSQFGTSGAGDNWSSGLVGSGDPREPMSYNNKSKGRLSKRLPLGDRKGTLRSWAFTKI